LKKFAVILSSLGLTTAVEGWGEEWCYVNQPLVLPREQSMNSLFGGVGGKQLTQFTS